MICDLLRSDGNPKIVICVSKQLYKWTEIIYMPLNQLHKYLFWMVVSMQRTAHSDS